MFVTIYYRSSRCRTGIIMLLICILLLGRPALAAETLSLDQAIQLTLQNNPTLHQFTFKDTILEAQKQTNSLRPGFEVSAELENVAGSGGTNGLDAAESTIALSSVLELGGKRQARMSLADSRIEQFRWEQQAATLDVLGNLTTAFIEGLTFQANMELARESLNLSQSLLKTVQSRSAKGATPEAEVKRAKAALVRAELQLAASVSQFERQKVTLAQFWGVSDPAFTTLSGTLFQYREAEKFDQLFARIQSSPSLQVFLTETRVQEANLTLAKANARSDLTWQVGVRRLEESSDTAFVAGISVPLFSGRRNQGDVRAAEAQRDSAATAEKAALLRLHSELFQAFTLRAQSIDAVSRIKGTAIPALESALELTQRAYRNGRYRYQDLIAAQQELLMAKQSLIESASTALISQAVIEELTGQALNP